MTYYYYYIIILKCVYNLRIFSTVYEFIESPQTYLELYSSPIHPRTASCKTSGCDNELMLTPARLSNKVQLGKKTTEKGNLYSASKLSLRVTCVVTFSGFITEQQLVTQLILGRNKQLVVTFTLDFRLIY